VLSISNTNVENYAFCDSRQTDRGGYHHLCMSFNNMNVIYCRLAGGSWCGTPDTLTHLLDTNGSQQGIGGRRDSNHMEHT
jgi:hypothetical protein